MKHKDITKQILALHEEDILKQMMNEIQTELNEGVSNSLQQEIDFCLNKINSEEVSKSDKVVSLIPKNKFVYNSFAETELLAASGQSLSDWFSQPLSFGAAGFVLDIRRVMGTNNEVDLYLKPNQSDASKMKNSLSSYLGKSLNICVSNHGVNLLTAILYVDESGLEAEGSGQLINTDDAVIKGKISIEIMVE